MNIRWPHWNKLKHDGIIDPLYGASPENCYVDIGAKMGHGTKIWPGVTIDKHVVIGEDCEIGKGATIIGNIWIGDNVEIGHNVKITGAGYIGDGCKIKSDIENPRMKKGCKVLTST